jgi:hypothetical protein
MRRVIELIEASIEEIKEQIEKKPSRERSIVLTHLQTAYLWAANEDNLIVQK